MIIVSAAFGHFATERLRRAIRMEKEFPPGGPEFLSRSDRTLAFEGDMYSKKQNNYIGAPYSYCRSTCSLKVWV